MATKRIKEVNLLYKPIPTDFNKAFLGVGLLAAIGILGFVLTRNSPPATHRLVATPSIPVPLTSTPSPVISEMPNKLVVTRPEDKTDHLSALSVTITDEAKVRKLFEEIYALPTFVPGVPYSCPAEYFSKYMLDFYLNNTLISHGLYTPTGCPTIKLDNLNARVDWHSTFASDFQQALGLSRKDFYGYQH